MRLGFSLGSGLPEGDFRCARLPKRRAARVGQIVYIASRPKTPRLPMREPPSFSWCNTRRLVGAPLLLGIGLLAPRPVQAQAPADWGPVSVDLADIAYPHLVQTFPLVVYGQNVNM